MSRYAQRPDDRRSSGRQRLHGNRRSKFEPEYNASGFSTRRTSCPFPDCQSSRGFAAKLDNPYEGYCHCCGRYYSQSRERHVDEVGPIQRSPMRATQPDEVICVTGPKLLVTYFYHDEHGQLLFGVDRIERLAKYKSAPTVWRRRKTFRQWRPSDDGSRIYRMLGARRVLYHLPQVIEVVQNGGTVVIVEGEKDADRLNEYLDVADIANVVATTAPGGAEKWRLEYNAPLRGADVIIWGDDDAPGRRHVLQVARALRGVARRVRRVALPPEVPAKDAAEYLTTGPTRFDVIDLLAAAPEVCCE